MIIYRKVPRCGNIIEGLFCAMEGRFYDNNFRAEFFILGRKDEKIDFWYKIL